MSFGDSNRRRDASRFAKQYLSDDVRIATHKKVEHGANLHVWSQWTHITTRRMRASVCVCVRVRNACMWHVPLPNEKGGRRVLVAARHLARASTAACVDKQHPCWAILDLTVSLVETNHGSFGFGLVSPLTPFHTASS